MGCYEPSETHQQRYIVDTAKLFIEVARRLNTARRLIPESVRKEINEDSRSISHNSTTPSLFCQYIKDRLAEDKKAFEDFMYNGRDPLARRLATWWDEHQIRDAKRNDSGG